jgi:UDP-GlcNAc3NAcA epimerase
MPQKCQILTVLGARPQFIKAAAVSRALRNRAGNFREIIVHTGQHFDNRMSDVFFAELGLPEITYNLGIDSLSHGAMTGRMLEAAETVIERENPDYVMVYGDTNSTLAGALAGKKLHKKIIHIEAGLRSFDERMPEEINRILTDRISNLLFCPTQTAVRNLQSEGFSRFPVKIINSGDVMFDSYLFFKGQAQTLFKGKNLPADFILCTLHRAENTNDPERLKTILKALDELSREIKIILPLHPRTRKIIESSRLRFSRLEFAEPVGYLEMINLLENCRLVITDSGGLQKEAFFAGKFCLTLRDTTEWTELVESGYNLPVAIKKNLIVENAGSLLRKKADFAADFYGQGNAAEIIASEIWKDFSENG